MVMSNLTTLELSPDKSTVKLGPGHRWGAVYDFLADHDLAVAGGRLGPVGVPGLLLGGGISFYGNQVGFSADTVISYEVVLADGTIVSATAHEEQDLFWALKGGSSNFGIVTQFEMETIPSKQVWAGILTYAEENIGEVYKVGQPPPSSQSKTDIPFPSFRQSQITLPTSTIPFLISSPLLYQLKLAR